VLRLNEELKVTKTKNRLGAGKREYFLELPRFDFAELKGSAWLFKHRLPWLCRLFLYLIRVICVFWPLVARRSYSFTQLRTY